jgi:hypothetical protein
MSQENTLNRYVKQTEMSFFFFYKIGQQEGRTGPVRRGVVGPSGGGRNWGKGLGE